MYFSTLKDPEPLASETESPDVNSSLSRKRVPTSKWAMLGVRLDVNGLVLVDEGVSTLLSGLPNGVSKSLDFRLVDFRLVGDIAASEIGLGHLVGVYLVAMEVAFPDGIDKIDFDVKHLADSVSLVFYQRRERQYRRRQKRMRPFPLRRHQVPETDQ
jgi:hypothetical protein